MRLKLDLAEDAVAELIRRAVQDDRPMDRQAEVELRRALDLEGPTASLVGREGAGCRGEAARTEEEDDAKH
jgi:hypothetical protein